MKLPPGAPPPNDQRPLKKPEDGDWDDALGDRKVQTVSPDIVRKLLEMNPALRAQGLNTNFATAQAQKAQIAAARGHKALPQGQTQNANEDIFSAFASMKNELGTQQKHFDVEVERLTRERAALRTATLDRVHRWLQTNDPDMRSPVTQEVLEQDKSFLEDIGFSVKEYVASRLKKPT